MIFKDLTFEKAKKEFQIICPISEGSYGKVVVIGFKEKFYALKITDLKKYNFVNCQNLVNEVNIQMSLRYVGSRERSITWLKFIHRHPKILRMLYCFVGYSNLYTLIEYRPLKTLFNLQIGDLNILDV